MNKIGMLPANGHRIQGRSSEEFLDSDEILKELNLNGTESLMDAGCGDGHIAIKALDYLPNGKVYALDFFKPSIEDMLKFKQENTVENLYPICSDISDHIDLEDNVVDIVLLVNVFHGFNATRKIPEAILELKRIIKPDGKIVVVDYKKQDVRHGPPYKIRLGADELKEFFSKEYLELVYLNEEFGESIPEGKSHLVAIFQNIK